MRGGWLADWLVGEQPKKFIKNAVPQKNETWLAGCLVEQQLEHLC